MDLMAMDSFMAERVTIAVTSNSLFVQVRKMASRRRAEVLPAITDSRELPTVNISRPRSPEFYRES